MSQIKEVNTQIITAIKKDDPFYETLWGKEDFTPEQEITEPNDYNCGAISNVLEYLYEFIRQITNDNYKELRSSYIDIIIYFFTGLKRFPGEPDVGLINRMESLIVRECDYRSTVFMTPWDIMNVFCYYVERQFLYYIPNGVLNNEIINGDFELPITSEWVFSPSGNRSQGDAFTGNYKVDFAAIQSVSQTIAVTTGAYILNSFVRPIAPPPEGFASVWGEYNQEFIVNGDFEDAITSEWVFSPSGNRSQGGANTGDYKLDFTPFDSVSQNVAVKEGRYKLSSYVRPIPNYTEQASMWVQGELATGNASYLDQDYQNEDIPEGNVIDVFNLIVQRDSDNFYYNESLKTWGVSQVLNVHSMSGNVYGLSELLIDVDGEYNINIKYDKIVDFYLDTIAMSFTSFPSASYLDQDFMYSASSTNEGTIEAGTAVFNLSVQRDSDGFFYDTSNDTWGVTGVSNVFTASDAIYQLSQFFIVVTGNYNITIKYEKIAEFFLDRIEFGKKEYPYFEILYLDKGAPEGFASSWKEGIQLENASYLDQDFMFSSATSSYSDNYYQELMDMVKPAGVKGIWIREVSS